MAGFADDNPDRSTALCAQRGGYSLIELLTVLTLGGIILAMAIPRIDFGGYALRGAATAAGSTLLAAQRRAVQQQYPVIVSVDTATSRFRLHDDPNGNGEIDMGETVRWEPLNEAIRFASFGAPPILGSAAGVTFTEVSDGFPSLTFYRNGAASEEGGFYLAPASQRNAAEPRGIRAVRVQRSTGKPDWFYFDGQEWKEGSQ